MRAVDNSERYVRERREKRQRYVQRNDVKCCKSGTPRAGRVRTHDGCFECHQCRTVDGGRPHADRVVVPLAFAYGGVAQIIAGILEFKNGNTFGTVAFTSYGLFWWWYAFLLWTVGAGWIRPPAANHENRAGSLEPTNHE